MLRQQTWGNRLYFSSFTVPVLEAPTYVGSGGIPRVLGAEGACCRRQENPFLELGSCFQTGPGLIPQFTPMDQEGIVGGSSLAAMRGAGVGIEPASLLHLWSSPRDQLSLCHQGKPHSRASNWMGWGMEGKRIISAINLIFNQSPELKKNCLHSRSHC